MRAPRSRHGDQLIDGAVLRGAIGASALRALFHDLEFGGILLKQGKTYSLKDISRCL